MKGFVAFLVKKARFLRGFIPRKLPVGRTEFDNYCDWLFETYGLPNMPGYRQAVATMVMHLPPTVYYKAPYYFGSSIKKAQANEVAYHVIEEEREARKKAQAEAAAKEQVTGEASPKAEKTTRAKVQNT